MGHKGHREAASCRPRRSGHHYVDCLRSGRRAIAHSVADDIRDPTIANTRGVDGNANAAQANRDADTGRSNTNPGVASPAGDTNSCPANANPNGANSDGDANPNDA